MCRKLMLVAIVALSLIAGCSGNADRPALALSALAATDVESSQNETVIGLELEQENVTVGMRTHLIGTHGEDQFYSIFATVALDDAGILGRPYFGWQAGIPTEDEDGGFNGPIAGMRHKVSDNLEWVTEGWYRSFNGPLKNMDYIDEWKALFGPRWRF